MAKQLSSLRFAAALALAVAAVASAECEGGTESCLAPELDTAAMIQLRGQQTWTQGCEWIPQDDCKNEDQYACACRAANPTGPCTACPGSQKKSTSSSYTQGCEWIPQDDCKNEDHYACSCRAANPHGPCTACPGSHKKSDSSSSSPSPSSSYTQGCEWIANDDCKNEDQYACQCRAANPHGPCTSCYPKTYSCDLSACHGCSGHQCSSCWSQKKTECCISQHCYGSSGEAGADCQSSCKRYN